MTNKSSTYLPSETKISLHVLKQNRYYDQLQFCNASFCISQAPVLYVHSLLKPLVECQRHIVFLLQS